MPLFDYTGKVVLITGIGAVREGYGNGTAMAAIMARQGAVIFGCDINLEAANKAADNINNEEETKAHPARSKVQKPVEVFQQVTVCFQSYCSSTINLLVTNTLPGRDQEIRLRSLRQCLHGE